MRLALLVLLLAPALAGCAAPAQPPTGTGVGPAPKALSAEAPWWTVGDAYTLRLERPGETARTYRLVNFWNDTQTAHFWLGVQERSLALDHALFDTNPFLGRIHHEILTPHEKGMHAAMYNFPLEDGKTWSGFFLNRNWTFRVREVPLTTPVGPDRGFEVTGQSTQGDGHRITYDYSPKVRWFTRLQEVDGEGRSVQAATLEGYEQGAKGTYVFLRGVDFYRGPRGAGTHDETFRVDDEVKSLAFHAQASASGPLEIQLLDPQGGVRHRASSTAGGQARANVEVAAPAQGTWTVRYVATGPIDGKVLAIGLQETTRTI